MLCFSKICFFPKFQLIEPVFRSVEIAIKIFGQPLFVSIDARLILDQSKHFRSIEPNFWSIKNRIESFFFFNLILMFNLLFKKFSNTLSLYSIGQGSNQFFCHFPSILLQGFSPLRLVRLFYPSFCIYFQVSCIFSCIFLGKFQTYKFLGFLMIQACFLQIDQWVFILRCYITVLDGLICSIWWFVRNWKF